MAMMNTIILNMIMMKMGPKKAAKNAVALLRKQLEKRVSAFKLWKHVAIIALTMCLS